MNNLEVALAAGRWLDAMAIAWGDSLTWPPGVLSENSGGIWLYHGTSGVALYYLEAHAATGDPHWLDQACRAADYLLAGMDSAAQSDQTLPPGLYEGVSGLGFVLSEVFKASGEPRFRDAADICLEAIADAAEPAGAGVQWADEDRTGRQFVPTDVMAGGAGIGLFLLYAGRVELAAAAGRRLIELSEPGPAGIRWRTGNPSHPAEMPNFSHGAAGAGYFLARLHAATGQAGFLDAAVRAADYLQSIAHGAPEVCLVPRFVPPQHGKPEYALGWCHGPYGTASLWFELHRATGDQRWLDWFSGSLRGFLTRAPEVNDFEPSRCWCHGSAGNAVILQWGHRVTGDPQLKAEADRLLQMTVESAIPDRGGLAWNEEGLHEGSVKWFPQTSFNTGAAGVGYALLLADALDSGRAPRVVLPDYRHLFDL